MNDVPGARQSRDPASAAAEVKSRLAHKKTLEIVKISRVFFFCFAHWIFRPFSTLDYFKEKGNLVYEKINGLSSCYPMNTKAEAIKNCPP